MIVYLLGENFGLNVYDYCVLENNMILCIKKMGICYVCGDIVFYYMIIVYLLIIVFFMCKFMILGYL